MLHNLHWVSSLFSIWTRSVRVSGSGFCQDYIIPPHHDLDFAKTTHHFVMTDTMAQQLVTNTENSPDETDNCVVWNESLKTLIVCMNTSSGQLHRFLIEESANIDLATKLDCVRYFEILTIGISKLVKYNSYYGLIIPHM